MRDLTEPAATGELTLAADSWTTRASLVEGRGGRVAAAVNGAIYAIGGEGGGNSAEEDDVYVFHPNNQLQVWIKRASMPQGRAFANGATVINGKIYVPGGFATAGGREKSLFVYNPVNNTWTQKANIPVPSAEGSSGAINGKLYMFSPASPGVPARPRCSGARARRGSGAPRGSVGPAARRGEDRAGRA